MRRRRARRCPLCQVVRVIPKPRACFRTHPTLCKWAGYLKFIFQVAFLHPIYRLLLGACRVCAVGAHAVARYAKLAVIPKPRACVPHTPYMVCNGRGYLKPPEHLCLPGKNLSGWLKLCALSFPCSPGLAGPLFIHLPFTCSNKIALMLPAGFVYTSPCIIKAGLEFDPCRFHGGKLCLT